MTCELQQGMRRRWKLLAAVSIALVVAGMMAGCGMLRGLVPEAEQPGDVVCPETGTYDADAVHALIAYHREIRALAAAELQQARRAIPDPGGRPLEQMRQAFLLSDPRGATDLRGALALLDAVLASPRDEAIAVRSLARMLAGELRERMRLSRQLESAGAQLRASEQVRAELQEKLDALTEIERSLPARPSPDTTVTPEPSERRRAQ